MKINIKRLALVPMIAAYAACSALTLCFSGCAGISAVTGESTAQQISANAEGAGEAVGSALLKKHSTAGVVDAGYLANYTALAPKIANVMAGAVTPADVHTLISDANGVALTSGQSAVVGYLDGLSPEFIAVNGTANGQAPTVNGAIADAAAKQFASGLERALGLVTGTNFVPPSK